MNNYMKISFPAKSENERLARTVCAAFVIGLDPTVEELTEIKTAISEAVTNAIIHAYDNESGMIEITAGIEENEVTYIIEDEGCGIEDVEKAKEPLFSGSGDSERSGMGFSIMEAFMDELHVESVVRSGTKIIMKKRITVNEK
ncbi:MAG: anti-sigma F factor [Oscillospiraceae bacterium]|nr:anti-sigma F factor [Oscillospiraceae bacterium]